MLLISLATMDDRLTVLKYAWHNESLGNTEHLRFTCSGMPKDARGDDVLWNKANFQEWNRGRAGMLEEHQLSLAVLCFHQLLLIESSTYYIFMRPQISHFSPKFLTFCILFTPLQQELHCFKGNAKSPHILCSHVIAENSSTATTLWCALASGWFCLSLDILGNASVSTNVMGLW